MLEMPKEIAKDILNLPLATFRKKYRNQKSNIIVGYGSCLENIAKHYSEHISIIILNYGGAFAKIKFIGEQLKCPVVYIYAAYILGYSQEELADKLQSLGYTVIYFGGTIFSEDQFSEFYGISKKDRRKCIQEGIPLVSKMKKYVQNATASISPNPNASERPLSKASRFSAEYNLRSSDAAGRPTYGE